MESTVDIVCYLWKGPDERRVFAPQHVNVLASMFKRHLRRPHRVICISDETEGFDEGIVVWRTPPAAAALAGLPTLEGPRFPSCYRRLWTFSREAADQLNPRVMVVDIDLVVLRDISHLFCFDAPFIGCRPLMTWGNQQRVAGGMYLFRPADMTRIYDDFDSEAPMLARRAGYRGSDQAWISYCVGPNVSIWPGDAGLYSIRDMRNGKEPLPSDAAVVQFNGPIKPWDSPLPWVRDNWR